MQDKIFNMVSHGIPQITKITKGYRSISICFSKSSRWPPKFCLLWPLTECLTLEWIKTWGVRLPMEFKKWFGSKACILNVNSWVWCKETLLINTKHAINQIWKQRADRKAVTSCIKYLCESCHTYCFKFRHTNWTKFNTTSTTFQGSRVYH